MISFCFKYIVKEYKNARFGFVLIFLTHIVYAIGTPQPRGRHRQPMICIGDIFGLIHRYIKLTVMAP